MKLFTTAFFASLPLVLTACNSSSDSGGSPGPGPGPKLQERANCTRSEPCTARRSRARSRMV